MASCSNSGEKTAADVGTESSLALCEVLKISWICCVNRRANADRNLVRKRQSPFGRDIEVDYKGGMVVE